MSVFNSIRSVFLGVDLDAEKRRIDAANDQLDALNRERYGPAYPPLAREDYEQQVSDAFTDELAAGADRYRQAGDAIIGGTLKTALRAVPVWVWIAAAAVAAWYLWPVIRKRL